MVVEGLCKLPGWAMLGGIGNSEWLSECSEDDAMLLRLLLLLEVLGSDEAD